MRIAFLSNHNPLDKTSFSGTSHYMYRALQIHKGCSVRLIGHFKAPRRLRNRLRRPSPGPENISSGSFDGLDAVLSLVSTNLISTYSSQTTVPFVHCTDATPGFLREFYGYDLPARAFEDERAAYEKATLILFSSEFMLRRAVAEFGSNFAAKMAAIPWGANLDNVPAIAPEKQISMPIRLLFIGNDWHRKGGDSAVATLKEIQERGISAELHVVGKIEGEAKYTQGVINHGYLNKNKKRDNLVFKRLLGECHFLLLPTKADCTPMVIAEANSHGLPALASNVGGISSLISRGQNGEIFAPEAGPIEYADYLTALIKDSSKYETLSKRSFLHFNECLTWQAWTDSFLALLRNRLPESKA